MNGFEVFVPGRLCLLGEHADWASFMANQIGYSIIATTNQGLFAQVSYETSPPETTSLQLKYSTHIYPDSSISYKFFDNEKSALQQAKDETNFYKYIFGVLHILEEHYSSILNQIMQQVKSIHVSQYKTDLPVKKGLSSSASICVLIVRIVNQLYETLFGKTCFSTEQEMEIAYLGERITGSQCGKLDQTVAYGKATMLLLQYEKNQQISISPIATLPQKLFFVIVDLQASKNTVRILQALQEAFVPFEKSISSAVIPEMHQKANQYLLDWNSQIVLQAKEAIEQGNATKIGQLMNDAQKAFDSYLAPLCTDQLSAPKLHQVLQTVLQNQELQVLGGKCVGSGGDGTVQFICSDEISQQQCIQFIEQQFQLPCITLNI